MIVIKNSKDLVGMSAACKIAASALNEAGKYMKVGVSTREIDEAVRKHITSFGAAPSFLGYGGFPASTCISINNQVIHGIPSKKVILKDGDIVSVDVGAHYNGFHGDNAYTYTVGEVSDEARQLLLVTEQCLRKGIEMCKPGNRVGDISNAVQTHAEKFGYAVVRKFVGHGVGRLLHEGPEVPNFGVAGKGARLVKGMTLAIEPMINLKGEDVKILSDGWTVETVSGSISAHFEHTVVITENGVKVMTV